MLLSKDQIIGVSDLSHRDVDVKEWGGSVRLGSLTSSERDSFESSLLETDGKRDLNNLRARLVGKCLVDEDGKRLFSDAAVEKLGEKSADVMGRLFTECQEMNGFDTEVEEAEKN